jgi:large subunit ribosomal protein L4
METVKYKTLNNLGASSGEIDLNPAFFAAVENPTAIHSVVRWQRGKARAGTHAALERSQMKGGGKKPWKQKGTGRARAGSSVSPLWVGGAVVHGPRPRSYETRLNKKVKFAALVSSISRFFGSETAHVLDTFECSGKTKDGANLLKVISPTGRKVLVVHSSDEALFARSVRNIKGVKVLHLDGVNVYDIMNNDALVISKPTLGEFQRRLSERCGITV